MKTQLSIVLKSLPLVLAIGVGSTQAAPVFENLVGTDPNANGSVDASAAPATARSTFIGLIKDDSTKKVDTFSTYPLSTSGLIGGLNMSGTLGVGVALTVPGANDFVGGRVAGGGSVDLDNGRFDTTGDDKKQWWLSSVSFTLDFSSIGGVSAFAFYGTDFGDFGGTFSLLLQTAGQTGDQGHKETFDFSGIQAADGNSNGWLTHIGFYDQTASYERIVFLIDQPGGDGGDDYLGFDDFMIGTLRDAGPNPNPVPEPGSLALVGASLVALTAARRRRAGSNKA